jgi:hypothetical protein
MSVLCSLIYSYVAVCRFCAVCYLIICFSMLFYNYSTYVLQYSLYVCFLFCIFSILFILCFRIVLCIVSPFVPFPIFKQVYWLLLLGGKPNAVNKHHIIYHTISYIISYRIISYHIISYHIISHRFTSRHVTSRHVIYHIVSCIILYITYNWLHYFNSLSHKWEIKIRTRWAGCFTHGKETKFVQECSWIISGK